MKKLIVLVCMLISLTSYARPVGEGVGMQLWSAKHACGSDATTTVDETTGGTPALMNAGFTSPSGSYMYMVADAQTAVCFTMTEGGAGANQCKIDTTNLEITDDTDAGMGVCLEFVSAGDKWVLKPNAAYAAFVNGIRTGNKAGCAAGGWCSKSITTAGETLHPPCTVDADCTGAPWSLAGATCIETTDVLDDSTYSGIKRNAGLYVLCEGVGAATNVTFSKEVTAQY